MKKSFLTLLVLPLAFVLASCNSGNPEVEVPTSGLRGTYTKTQIIDKNYQNSDLRITNDASSVATTGNLYSSNYYPLDTVNGTKVNCTIKQSLKLNKDFSYLYQQTITMKNTESVWGKEFAQIEVESRGTFEYENTTDMSQEEITELTYSVSLSKATSGSLKIYGCSISGEGSIFAWTIQTNPTFELNIAKAVSQNDFDYTSYNGLLNSKTVEVRKGEEKVIEDNLYSPYLLAIVAPYCEYTF